jgi:hypothetical protein
LIESTLAEIPQKISWSQPSKTVIPTTKYLRLLLLQEVLRIHQHHPPQELILPTAKEAEYQVASPKEQNSQSRQTVPFNSSKFSQICNFNLHENKGGSLS